MQRDSQKENASKQKTNKTNKQIIKQNITHKKDKQINKYI